ncbi:hypothetical protein F4775DRAFT_587830 [Biscogniauxia sp. FL1348]|nr:hypothetical protein F4775DRAFT_587830 [Biscogniauxia sp. FL1348]
MSHTKKKPMHLEPSKLGTKEYWDELYTNEISNHAHDPSDTGTVWFDDSDAEAKIIEFVSSPSFSSTILLPPPPSSPSSPSHGAAEEERKISFLDLGTGNGSLLFGLCDAEEEEEEQEDEDGGEDGDEEGNGYGKTRLRHPPWGTMLGVDYSARSVEFARRIERERRRRQQGGKRSSSSLSQPRDEEHTRRRKTSGDAETCPAPAPEEVEEERPRVRFLEHDILRGDPAPLLAGPQARGWDVVLDKGTFDAVSLCPPENLPGGMGITASEMYRDRVLPLVRPGGVFLVTSCNWTEEELRAWFEDDGEDDGEGKERRSGWGFEVAGRVAYPSFSFAGVKGQAISTLCFRKNRVE